MNANEWEWGKSPNKGFSHHSLEQDNDHLWGQLLKTCSYPAWHPCCLSQTVVGSGDCWSADFSSRRFESNCPGCDGCEAGVSDDWWGSALSGDQELGMPILTGWLIKSWGPWHVPHLWRLNSKSVVRQMRDGCWIPQGCLFPSRQKQRDRHKRVAFQISHWELVYAWLPCIFFFKFFYVI